MRDLMLLAASGLAREVLATVRVSGQFRVTGFLDDAPDLQGTLVDGVPVAGGIEDAAFFHDADFLVCVGSGTGRRQIVRRLAGLGITDDRFGTVLEQGVRVPPGCMVGHGSILLANVVLTAGVTVGAHVVAMPQVTMTHDNVVEDYATLAAGVTLGGNVHIGSAAYLGMNSSVRQGLRIGRQSTLGMGAVLLEDLPSHETWAGVPAKPIRQHAAHIQ
ncbi:acetyltransferase [Arthrobacter sp. NyZ413]|uniref:acetyltransferase n=1 Tax=Arthrobacter sp. NyZ413 TaxID=3144669 RepID=UPI003BF82E82